MTSKTIRDAEGKVFYKSSENIDGSATYTRSVPDVPELKRFEFRQAEYLGGDNTLETAEGEDADNGEYVLYTQAAEIIAAKDAEIDRLRQLFTLQTDTHAEHVKGLSKRHEKELEIYGKTAQGFRERAEAAEAKLAQYEAQEPVGYLLGGKLVYGYEGRSLNDLRSKGTPLYASPAPSADLKSENEKLTALVQNITKFDIGSPEHFRAVYDARSALNP